MKGKSSNMHYRNIFLVPSLFYLFSINSVFACADDPRVYICNHHDASMSVAVYFETSGFMGLNCILRGEGCYGISYGWVNIKPGHCGEVRVGLNYEGIYSVQLQKPNGDWYAPSYRENADIMNNMRRRGLSGLTGRSMCVTDTQFERRLDNLDLLTTETCPQGYYRVPVNLFIRSDCETEFTATLR